MLPLFPNRKLLLKFLFRNLNIFQIWIFFQFQNRSAKDVVESLVIPVDENSRPIDPYRDSSFFFDDLACSGHEMSLFDCPSPGFKEHNCDVASEIAGVICTEFPGFYKGKIPIPKNA